MKVSVIVFPGSNCDRDVKVALTASLGSAPDLVWHGVTELPETDAGRPGNDFPPIFIQICQYHKTCTVFPTRSCEHETAFSSCFE